MILWACDRWEAYKGPIKTLFECEDTREVNGENALSITTLARLDKGDRLVWRDLKGRWHENIVDGVEEERASAGILYTYYCPTSAQIELLGDYLEDKRPYDVSAYAALASALSSSRWQVGTVADLGQAGTNFYHTNAWAAIHDVADTWGGELSFEIQVSGTKVTARRVCMAKQVGEDNGKRFTYAKDLVSVKRSVDEGNVCTALYGYGKSLQTADEDGNLTGGYDRKLTFGDVNGGQNWVGSADALARWGRPDGKGGKAHVFGDVEFSDCEDAAELKKLTEAQLAKSCVPTVSYTADAVALARAGEGFEGADEGDLVTVVDKVYDPPLRVRTRITKVVEDQLRPGEVTYTFGNYQTVAELMAAQKSATKSTASTIRATVTEAVNASNKASTGKWGESLAAAEERQKAYAKEVGGAAQDYTDQIRDELDKALKEYADNGDTTLEEALKKYSDDGNLDLDEVLRLYTDTSIEQSESVLKKIDEANKEYLEGVTGKLDERLTSAEGEVDGLQKQLDQLPTDIRKKIVDMLNSEVNTTGGWVYEEPGQGILVYDKKPESATKCVKIGGGIIGVANSKYSNGAWKWRTAITGDGVTADELTTGRIKGGNSYWDLGRTGPGPLRQRGLLPARRLHLHDRQQRQQGLYQRHQRLPDIRQERLHHRGHRAGGQHLHVPLQHGRHVVNQLHHHRHDDEQPPGSVVRERLDRVLHHRGRPREGQPHGELDRRRGHIHLRLRLPGSQPLLPPDVADDPLLRGLHEPSRRATVHEERQQQRGRLGVREAAGELQQLRVPG